MHDLCNQITTVFHLASAAGNDDGSSNEQRHYASLLAGTRVLLQEAVRSSVKSFIYVSSVKAMGEVTNGCVDETAKPNPLSAYGRAKLQGEEMVGQVARRGLMHACILRLPLVYGPNPKSNLMQMIAAVDQGRFPPLAETGNKRSMVYVGDVARALILAAQNPAARGQMYLVTDDRVYSTRQIYDAICRALGRTVAGWSLSSPFLRLMGAVGDAFESVTGRNARINGAVLEKLLGSAWYSSDKIRRELGFLPTHTLESALPEMVETYREIATTSR